MTDNGTTPEELDVVATLTNIVNMAHDALQKKRAGLLTVVGFNLIGIRDLADQLATQMGTTRLSDTDPADAEAIRALAIAILMDDPQ